MVDKESHLINWRLDALEANHESMQKALSEMSATLSEMVLEIRISKRVLSLVVIMIGMLQPVVFHYMK